MLKCAKCKKAIKSTSNAVVVLAGFYQRGYDFYEDDQISLHPECATSKDIHKTIKLLKP